jgi:homoserine/homoserine lactone efflux protein
MIEPSLLIAFAFSVTVLMLIPGPNVALIVAGSIAHGPRHGLVTVAGTVTAQALSLGLIALGMSEYLGVLGNWFIWLRWLGALYLIWLGIAQWRVPATDLNGTPPLPRSAGANFMRAFLVSLTNPKTLVFYTAFFPQFVTLKEPVGPQVALLAAVFLSLAALIDSGWAFAAGRTRAFFATRRRFSSRLSGGILIGAGAVLALARHR